MTSDRLRFVRFCLVGGAVTALNYALLIAFVALGFHYLVANSFAWVICVCVNFAWTRRFTFVQRGNARAREMVGFAMTSVLQYLIATASMALCVDGLQLGLTAAFLLTLSTTTVFSYTMLHKLVFTPRPQEEEVAWD